MILENKKVVIMGVRNKWSIAWGAVKSASEQGAKVICTTSETNFEKVKQLLEEIPDSKLYICNDVSKDEDIEKCLEQIKSENGKIDGIVHAIAHANTEDLHNDFIYTSKEGFAHACDVSAYSFVLIARMAKELDMLNEKFKNASPVDEFVHQKLLSMFFVYLIVGGMPDAVKTYIETKDIREVDKVQRDITTLYKEDFSQYEIEDRKLKLKSIYDIIPAELNKQNKKFVFTMLDKELKFDRYENSFLWLKDAGVALPVYNIEAPVIPLLASKSSNIFRLFSSDIGLLTSAYPAETKMELINKNGEVNNGAHFENAVAQQLTANGFTPYFCKKRNIGEMDFVIEMNGKVVPIEVKSGKAYKSHKALDNFMNIPDYHLEKAYVFSVGNVETEGTVTYLPIYMCYLLKEQKLGQMIVELDTTGL